LSGVELGFFENIGEVARLGLDIEVDDLHMRAHKYGVKVWFGEEKAAKEHYEAQIVSTRHLTGNDGIVLEIGFHAEHRDVSLNQAALDKVLAQSQRWAEVIGTCVVAPADITHDEAVADQFLGNSTWRRISETWVDPDMSDTELSIEAGARLADYINCFQPILAP
jgi:hypothetical protein